MEQRTEILDKASNTCSCLYSPFHLSYEITPRVIRYSPKSIPEGRTEMLLYSLLVQHKYHTKTEDTLDRYHLK